MKRIHLFISATCAFVTASVEAQDISVSMSECAAIYDVLAESASYRGKAKEQIDRMLSVSAEFKVHAVKRAVLEGKNEPEPFVQNIYNIKRTHWADRWFDSSDISFLTNFSENMDWMKYCASMGKHYEVLPVK